MKQVDVQITRHVKIRYKIARAVVVCVNVLFLVYVVMTTRPGGFIVVYISVRCQQRSYLQLFC